MTREDLISGIGAIEDQYVLEAEKYGKLSYENDSHEKNRRRKMSKKKMFFVSILAAGMVFGTVAFAAENEYDIALRQEMGIGGNIQLPGGTVMLDETDTENGIRMQAVSSIGDKNHAWIRISTDYPYQSEDAWWDLRINVSKAKDESDMQERAASWYTKNNNGLTDIYLEITAENINRSWVTLDFENILDENGDILVTGQWHLKWKYEYQSNTKTHYCLKKVELDGREYYITKMEISPITTNVHAIRDVFLEEEGYDDVQSNLTPHTIVLKDGTEISVKEDTGSMSNSWYYTATGILKESVFTSEVESVIIGDEKMDL